MISKGSLTTTPWFSLTSIDAPSHCLSLPCSNVGKVPLKLTVSVPSLSENIENLHNSVALDTVYLNIHVSIKPFILL